MALINPYSILGTWSPAPLVEFFQELASREDYERVISLEPEAQMYRPEEVELWVLYRLLSQSHMRDAWKTIVRHANRVSDHIDDLLFDFYFCVIDSFEVNCEMDYSSPSERARRYQEFVEVSEHLDRLANDFGVSGFVVTDRITSSGEGQVRRAHWVTVSRALGALRYRVESELAKESLVTSSRGNPVLVHFQRSLSSYLHQVYGHWLDDVVSGVASSLYPEIISKERVKSNRKIL